MDRGQACRIGYQWHKHRQYKHLRRRDDRIGRYRGLWVLTGARSQKLCLKFKTSHRFGKRPPGLAMCPPGFRMPISSFKLSPLKSLRAMWRHVRPSILPTHHRLLTALKQRRVPAANVTPGVKTSSACRRRHAGYFSCIGARRRNGSRCVR